MVYIREVAAARLRRLERCVDRLRRIAGSDRVEYLADEDAQTLAERYLQVAIQCLLDLGNYIVSEEGLGTPVDQYGIFDCLVRAGVLPKALAERTRGMAGLRNILVHDYLEVDQRIVHDLLQRVGELLEIGRHLAEHVDRRSEE